MWTGGPRGERATAIAVDLAAVCEAEQSRFGGPAGVEACGLALASIGYQETGLRERYERCDCRPGECDNGYALGSWQVHKEHLGEVTRDAFCADRRMQAKIALRVLSNRGGFDNWKAPFIAARFERALDLAGLKVERRPGRVLWALPRAAHSG